MELLAGWEPAREEDHFNILIVADPYFVMPVHSSYIMECVCHEYNFKMHPTAKNNMINLFNF